MAGTKLLPEIKAPGTGIANSSVPKSPMVASEPVAPVSQATPPVKKAVTKNKKQDLNSIMRIRRGVMGSLAKGVSPDAVANQISEMGIDDPLALETILSNDLTENVIKFFLNNTKNNPKKAKQLAQKFGFKV